MSRGLGFGRLIPPWVNQAACLNHDTEVFYPGSGAASQAARAKAICQTCPVRLPCLTYAMASEGRVSRQLRHGIFGGLTPTERARISPDHQQETTA